MWASTTHASRVCLLGGAAAEDPPEARTTWEKSRRASASAKQSSSQSLTREDGACGAGVGLPELDAAASLRAVTVGMA